MALPPLMDTVRTIQWQDGLPRCFGPALDEAIAEVRQRFVERSAAVDEYDHYLQACRAEEADCLARFRPGETESGGNAEVLHRLNELSLRVWCFVRSQDPAARRPIEGFGPRQLLYACILVAVVGGVLLLIALHRP